MLDRIMLCESDLKGLGPAAHRALTLHNNNTSGECSHHRKHTAHTASDACAKRQQLHTLIHTAAQLQQSCRQLQDVGPASRKHFRLSCDTLQQSYQSCCCCNGAVNPLPVNTSCATPRPPPPNCLCNIRPACRCSLRWTAPHWLLLPSLFAAGGCCCCGCEAGGSM